MNSIFLAVVPKENSENSIVRHAWLNGTFELMPDFLVIQHKSSESRSNIFSSKSKSVAYDEIIYKNRGLQSTDIVGILEILGSVSFQAVAQLEPTPH
mmetsp:Transcript_257/g.705  ORF Transcript_257/g.705 Transcript_257/m.705 type:complete len:97 (+) Transcript_257:500-790(+)